MSEQQSRTGNHHPFQYEKGVFVSYARGGELEEIVNRIEQVLKMRGVKIIRDRHDLGYRGSIREFMERIGQGNCVFVVISDKYLRSQNCMLELVEIAEGKQFHDRVFPIVLDDANIYDPLKKIEYVKYWEVKRAELAGAMQTVDPANLQGIRDDIDLYDRIRDEISGLISTLKDMNTLAPEMHIQSDYQILADAIAKRILFSDPLEQKKILRDRKYYAWRVLSWLLGISISLIVAGSFIQNISQPSDAIRWLIYRRGYPYFQAITFSALVVTSAIVLHHFIKEIVVDDKVPWMIRVLLKLLSDIFPEQNNGGVWRILLVFSIVSFIFSISFPRCLSSGAILVSFDIIDNGVLIAHISPGEPVLHDPGSYIDIEAKLEANLFNLAPPQVICKWATYTGDGRLVQSTNCKINYQTGIDRNPDPVVVNITQKGCASSLGYYSFFISNAP